MGVPVNRPGEEAADGLVRLAELAAVAFVEDENDTLVAQDIDAFAVPLAVDRVVELLQSGHDQLDVRVHQLLDQVARVAGAVHAAFGEFVELARGLVIKVLAVDHEQDLLDIRHALDDLGGLEGGEGLARARGVPDVAAGRNGAR
jgi:hypothetical protein